MVESIRKGGAAVLLVDCGALFDNTTQNKAELLLNAMETMGYDALNLGGPEFFFGKEFLEHSRSHVSFPYIASNLLSGGNQAPLDEGIHHQGGGRYESGHPRRHESGRACTDSLIRTG